MFGRFTRRVSISMGLAVFVLSGSQSSGASDLFDTPSVAQIDSVPAPILAPTTGLPATGSDRQPTVIPLPPAAWTGMFGLAGLGLMRSRRAIRKFFS